MAVLHKQDHFVVIDLI